MFLRGRLFRFLLTLLLVGVLIAGGVALYQAGFGQGYQAGVLATSAARSDGAAQPPVYGYLPAPIWPGYGFPFFHPFGIFLGIGFFLFVFFLIGGLFRSGGRRHWAENGGPENWRHGPGSHWGRGWGEQPTSQPQKGEETKETDPKG